MITELIGLLAANIIYLALHVTNSGSFPRTLTEQEERDYLVACKAGDLTARNKLIEHNLRLVAHIVKKYYSPQHDSDDLISIGTMGLIKAVATFDGEKQTKLATYAARCIEKATPPMWLFYEGRGWKPRAVFGKVANLAKN